jgi:hypothetical protein
VLGTCKKYLPNNITKNIFSVTSFLNNTAFNLTDELAIDAELSLANKTPLKLYVW